jgi:hypothetical protein
MEYLCMTKKNNGAATILSSCNQAIITVAKSLLEEAGINYTLKSHAYVNGDGSIEILVDAVKAIEARSLLADLEELDFDEQRY